MRFLPVNLDAVLVELDDLEQTLALLASLEAEPIAGVCELVPAARTLLVRFRPSAVSQAQLLGQIGRRPLVRLPERLGELIEIPVTYDGEDLDEVAAMLGLARDEVIRRHTGSDYTVAFTGFAPGFAYLSGGHPSLDVPRRRTPRTRIPAGAVALAGRFSGVYPKASPGGWQIIGVTTMPMWDLGRPVPALLQPGARVRFVDVALRPSGPLETRGQQTEPGLAGGPGQAASSAPLAPLTPFGPAASHTLATKATLATPAPLAALAALGDARPAAGSDAALHVLRPGLLATFQDLGRQGQASQGVSASGAMDRGALRAANRLVGNPAGSPCMEITCGGFECTSRGDTVVAITGADLPVQLTTATGESWTLPTHQALALADGDRLTLGEPRQGVRSYLALRGGFQVAPVLGSCATDTLAQIGPPALRAGDLLAARPVACGAIVGDPEAAAEPLPAPGQVVVLDLVLGPRTDWFTAEAVALLAAQVWTVTPQSNRVGLRLAGETPLARCQTAELPSEGTTWGAVQVPPSGQPVLFLADHPLTGGYPVIGAVAPHHLNRAGQIPVGAQIRFHVIRAFHATHPTDWPETP